MDSFLFQGNAFFTHFFSFLSAFLSSKPFQNNEMDCEITDRYFNVIFVEIQLKEKTWKVLFWHQSLGTQANITVSQMDWTHH